MDSVIRTLPVRDKTFRDEYKLGKQLEFYLIMDFNAKTSKSRESEVSFFKALVCGNFFNLITNTILN